MSIEKFSEIEIIFTIICYFYVRSDRKTETPKNPGCKALQYLCI